MDPFPSSLGNVTSELNNFGPPFSSNRTHETLGESWRKQRVLICMPLDKCAKESNRGHKILV